MRYRLVDVELTGSIPELRLSPGESGAAIVVRRKGAPVGFWLHERDAPLSAEAFGRTIAQQAGVRLVAEAVREELIPPPTVAPLPLVTVAICTKDRPEGVERLLRSLGTVDLPAGSAGLDILIVDNAPSDDRTLALADRYRPVRYVREPCPGLNFARNRALREARGTILIFVDDDVVPDRGWLRALASARADNPDAAAFTGQVLPLELETEAQVLFERRGGFRRGFNRVRYGPVNEGDHLYPGGAGVMGAGANMAFRTDALARLGGFDEALDTGANVPGGGDLDMFYRIIRAGETLVYEPGFMVFHQHRREMAALARQYRRSWGLGFLCYLTKCMRSDPERRVPLARLLVWWFKVTVTAIATNAWKKTKGQPHIPPSMLAGELWGGVVGLLGGYARSRRRVANLRRRYGQPTAAGPDAPAGRPAEQQGDA